MRKVRNETKEERKQDDERLKEEQKEEWEEGGHVFLNPFSSAASD